MIRLRFCSDAQHSPDAATLGHWHREVVEMLVGLMGVVVVNSPVPLLSPPPAPHPHPPASTNYSQMAPTSRRVTALHILVSRKGKLHDGPHS
ncbi:hypothetical protein E2C01_065579 [Portunus trituberculatus]|uniref:Uncharacterized protein n=1 Tax=Portunus trituberculatus TaxID=210409 RepID=A0A5B7HNS5_PORTR|nr:hypothetical protein [Portunus trituberculatus]